MTCDKCGKRGEVMLVDVTVDTSVPPDEMVEGVVYSSSSRQRWCARCVHEAAAGTRE